MSVVGILTAFAASAVKLFASAFSISVARKTWLFAPVTATRTPLAVCATNTPTSAKRDAGLLVLDVRRFLRRRKAHRGDQLAGLQRRLVQAGEEVVGGDRAPVGLDRRVQRQHARPDSTPPDRRWRSSRRSCPCCAPSGRRCRRPARRAPGSRASRRRSTPPAACVAIAPIVTPSPSALMPFRSAMPPRSTRRADCDRRSRIAWIRLWPPAR